ncbi:hypothetical protein P7K49_027507 [Saguinus oedipus]|uniref:Nucleoplasmin core domain-containing protein n=1 Tax=Saguinus oedipus TaxID=9490 RepID=A0ABQ9U9N1_SAGOE|nr:hypothetical protein P7K49_027507 [Saguinus oedipus]
MVGVQLSPPITFQLRAGSGPVFLSGQERYGKSELRLRKVREYRAQAVLGATWITQWEAGINSVALNLCSCPLSHAITETSDLTWEEEEEEEGEEEEEEEEEEDDEDEDVDISLEESPVKQGKRLVPQKQPSVAKVGEGAWLFGGRYCPCRSPSEGWGARSLGQPSECAGWDKAAVAISVQVLSGDPVDPYPDPKSQDSRNEELRPGGHHAEWAFPGLCCRDGAPLPHPCICLNVTGVLWGKHKSPSPPTLHFQEAPSEDPPPPPPPPWVTIKLSGQDFPSLPCCRPPYPLRQPKCPAEGVLEPAHLGPEVMPRSLDPAPSA